MTQAHIGIGSNLGDPAAQCEKAIDRLSTLGRITARSSFYLSEPLLPSGKPSADVPWYINAVISLETDFSGQTVFEGLKRIEKEMGREDGKKWSSRIIDLDLLFYGNEVIDETELKVPHPEIARRAFVLKPLAEIHPNLIHPTLHKTVTELLQECRDTLKIEKKP